MNDRLGARAGSAIRRGPGPAGPPRPAGRIFEASTLQFGGGREPDPLYVSLELTDVDFGPIDLGCTDAGLFRRG